MLNSTKSTARGRVGQASAVPTVPMHETTSAAHPIFPGSGRRHCETFGRPLRIRASAIARTNRRAAIDGSTHQAQITATSAANAKNARSEKRGRMLLRFRLRHTACAYYFLLHSVPPARSSSVTPAAVSLFRIRSPVAKSLAARASARSWIKSFMMPSRAACAAAGPLGAAGAVFERDADRAQRVADLVGDGEVLVLAGRGAELDHQRHHFGQQIVAARLRFSGRLR